MTSWMGCLLSEGNEGRNKKHQKKKKSTFGMGIGRKRMRWNNNEVVRSGQHVQTGHILRKIGVVYIFIPLVKGEYDEYA